MVRTSAGVVQGTLVCLAVWAGQGCLHAQELEDVAAIMFDAVAYAYERESWRYDQGAIERKVMSLHSGPTESLVFGTPENVTVVTVPGTYGYTESLHVARVRPIAFVKDRSDCVVTAGLYVDVEQNIDELVKAAERYASRYRFIKTIPSVNEFRTMLQTSKTEVTFYLNNVISNEILMGTRFDRGELRHSYEFSGEKDIYCESRVTYGSGWPPRIERKDFCFKAATAIVSQRNKARFENMIQTLYAKFCTGAKRSAGKF